MNTLNVLLALDNLEDFQDNFKLVKNQIIQLYTATNNFVDNLVVYIENNMINEIDYKSMKYK